MINVIIVEDEDQSRDALAGMLKEHFRQVNIIALCKNVDEGKAAIESYAPDLLFLDVELENRTGFDLLKLLDKITFDVIFTTGHTKYAIQAIKFSALDFMLKPFSISDLHEAINRFYEKREIQASAQQFDTLFHNLKHLNADAKKIALPTLNGLLVVPVKDIVRCESDINYTTFYLTTKNKLVVARTLKEFEELLVDYDFFRVHNSHLINLHHVNKYTRGEGGTVTMNDGTEVDVSRRKKDDFLKRLAAI